MKNKLKKLLEQFYNGNLKFKNRKLTPVTVHILTDIYEGKYKDFISEDVKFVLEGCGYSIKEKGIGWEIM